MRACVRARARVCERERGGLLGRERLELYELRLVANYVAPVN